MQLAIPGVRYSNIDGEPVPHKTGWQHHPGIMVLGQDIDGTDITIEAASDDMHWLETLSKNVALHNTVILDQPTFFASKCCLTSLSCSMISIACFEQRCALHDAS